MSTQQNERRATVQLELIGDIGIAAQCIEDFASQVKTQMAKMMINGAIALSQPNREVLEGEEASRMLTESAGELAELSAVITDIHSRMHEYVEPKDGGGHT